VLRELQDVAWLHGADVDAVGITGLGVGAGAARTDVLEVRHAGLQERGEDKGRGTMRYVSSEEELAARLDEDEDCALAAARADGRYAGRPHWSASGGIVTDAADPDWAVVDISPYTEDASLGAHIARHDPARVLRYVEAVRAILTEIKTGGGNTWSPDYYEGLNFALLALGEVYDDGPVKP
jgi:hypothetical protein